MHLINLIFENNFSKKCDKISGWLVKYINKIWNLLINILFLTLPTCLHVKS